MQRTQRRSAGHAQHSGAVFAAPYDAAFALLLIIICTAGFLALFFSASGSARAAAEEEQGSSQALRLSFFALSEIEEKEQGLQQVPYYESNVVDPGMLSLLKASELAGASGRGFASYRLEAYGGETISQSFGKESGQVHCASLLVLYSGKPALFKVCIS